MAALRWGLASEGVTEDRSCEYRREKREVVSGQSLGRRMDKSACNRRQRLPANSVDRAVVHK